MINRALAAQLSTWLIGTPSDRDRIARELGPEQTVILQELAARIAQERDRFAVWLMQPLSKRIRADNLPPIEEITGAKLLAGHALHPAAVNELARVCARLIVGNVPRHHAFEARLRTEFAELAGAAVKQRAAAAIKREEKTMANCAGGWASSAKAFEALAPAILQAAPDLLKTGALPHGAGASIADRTGYSRATIGFVCADLKAGRPIKNAGAPRAAVESPLESEAVPVAAGNGRLPDPPGWLETQLRIRAVLPSVYSVRDLAKSVEDTFAALTEKRRVLEAELREARAGGNGNASELLEENSRLRAEIADRDGAIEQLRIEAASGRAALAEREAEWRTLLATVGEKDAEIRQQAARIAALESKPEPVHLFGGDCEITLDISSYDASDIEKTTCARCLCTWIAALLKDRKALAEQAQAAATPPPASPVDPSAKTAQTAQDEAYSALPVLKPGEFLARVAENGGISPRVLSLSDERRCEALGASRPPRECWFEEHAAFLRLALHLTEQAAGVTQ